MDDFKIGDKVLVGPDGLIGVKAAAGKIGVVLAQLSEAYLIQFSDRIQHDNDADWKKDKWYGSANNLSLTSGPVSPSKRATQRASYRLNQAILKHLESGKSISPMEALVVHGCLRLAAAICDLRQVGHNIKTDIHRDSNGKQYARYSLTSNCKVAA